MRRRRGERPGERRPFEPTNAYHELAELAITAIFENPQVADSMLPHAAVWEDAGRRYVATRSLYTPEARKLFGVTVTIARPLSSARLSLRRSGLTPDGSGLVEHRSYRYQDQALQAVTAYRAPEDEATYRVANSDLAARVKQEQEEFGQGIHRPSKEEYADFLVDLGTFALDKMIDIGGGYGA